VRTFVALVGAGFRRYSTYRQATIAGIFTNTVFGFLICYVLLAVARGRGGPVAGYQGTQLVTLAWINQGLLATVGLWGDSGLADRIRSGDVVADLLRPIHPVLNYLGTDLGRAGFSVLTRFAVPMLVGALVFPLYVPQRAASYPLFVVSAALATLLSFACRYLVQCSAFWLLDIRGPQVAWTLLAGVLGGLYFPIRFLPRWFVDVLWVATPFPSLLQTPVDIIVERVSPAVQGQLIGLQVLWVGLAFGACVLVQRAAERKLVVQGG